MLIFFHCSYFLFHQGLSSEINLATFCDGGPDCFEAYVTNMSKGGVAADPVAVVATALFLQRNIMLVTSVPGSSHTKSVLWVQGKASYDKLVPDSVFLGYERLQTYIPLRPAADMVCKVYIVVENISQTRTAHNYSA